MEMVMAAPAAVKIAVPTHSYQGGVSIAMEMTIRTIPKANIAAA